jgi:hypothetical protein
MNEKISDKGLAKQIKILYDKHVSMHSYYESAGLYLRTGEHDEEG